MENASKALLMAAGVLIGIMILSLGVYIFTQFGGTSAQIYNNIEQNQINQFNTQFTSYETKEYITIYDIISMANLATQNNKKYEYTKRTTSTGEDSYIAVKIGATSIEYGYGAKQSDIEEDYNKRIEEQVKTGLKKYKAKVYISTISKKVYQVVCSEI